VLCCRVEHGDGGGDASVGEREKAVEIHESVQAAVLGQPAADARASSASRNARETMKPRRFCVRVTALRRK